MPLLFSRSAFWILLAFLAFVFLPAQALHYGIGGATKAELLAAMGWHRVNLTWAWFAPLLLFPVLNRISALRLRSLLELGWVSLIALFLIISAAWTKTGFGYAVIFLVLALIAIATQALAHLNIMQGDRFMIGVLLGIVLIIVVFILYPMVSVFVAMFNEGNPLAVFAQMPLLRIIWHSVGVSATVGLLATFFGLVLALYTTRIATKQTLFLGKFFSVLPIVTPPFVVSLGVMLMFGRSGYVTSFLVTQLGFERDWLYGFTGIAFSHTLALTPMAFLILEGALKSMNTALEEASYSLRASSYQTFRYILFPLLKPALANAFLVVTVQSLADFSTPFVLGGNFDVLASQIYFYLIGTQLDYAAASTLGTILLAFSLLIFWVQYRWIGKHSYVTVSGKAYRSAFQPLPSGLKAGIICILTAWVALTALLYGSIFYGSFTVNWGVDHTFTIDNYRTLFGQGLNQGGFPSLIQTLLFALCAAPITAVISLLSAYLSARREFIGKQTLEFIMLLCFAVPGTVAGVSYVLAFNHAPIYLTGTGAIIVLSMVTRNMPIGMRACMAGLRQIDKSLDEASLSLRVGTLRTLLFVILPMLKPAFLSALVTSFVRSMTTISAIIFLVSPSTRVATSYILNRVEDGDYGLAVAYGSALIVIMMLIIGLFNCVMREK